jgi:hypothetical protein
MISTNTKKLNREAYQVELASQQRSQLKKAIEPPQHPETCEIGSRRKIRCGTFWFYVERHNVYPRPISAWSVVSKYQFASGKKHDPIEGDSMAVDLYQRLLSTEQR